MLYPIIDLTTVFVFICCFTSSYPQTITRHHIVNNNLGNTFQSAYKSCHSIETALLSIKNDIHISLSKGGTINHTGLSSRFGFSGTVLKQFRSYISGRQQSVKVGSTLFDPVELKFGVPQRSVLGPVLFSLYTTPLSKIISAYKNHTVPF